MGSETVLLSRQVRGTVNAAVCGLCVAVWNGKPEVVELYDTLIILPT